jgi:hypothetical protein
VTKSLLAILLLTAMVARSMADDQHLPPVVSMIELIANNEKYNGKLVQVSGFISISFEDDALYLDSDAYAHLFTEDALWINFDEKERGNFESVNRRYGYIIGLFRHNECNGHLCLYAGQLESARVGVTFTQTREGDEGK